MSLVTHRDRRRPNRVRPSDVLIVVIDVHPARLEWLEALESGDDVFISRFGIPVVDGWVGFPEALAPAVDGARNRPENPWGSHLFFDDTDGALVGFGGFKGAPRNGEVELGYAVAPSRRGRGIATSVVGVLVSRARAAGVRTVSAHTLGAENPSTTVLRYNRFVRTRDIDDPDEGIVWRWELPSPRATPRCRPRTPERSSRRPVLRIADLEFWVTTNAGGRRLL